MLLKLALSLVYPLRSFLLRFLIIYYHYCIFPFLNVFGIFGYCFAEVQHFILVQFYSYWTLYSSVSLHQRNQQQQEQLQKQKRQRRESFAIHERSQHGDGLLGDSNDADHGEVRKPRQRRRSMKSIEGNDDETTMNEDDQHDYSYSHDDNDDDGDYYTLGDGGKQNADQMVDDSTYIGSGDELVPSVSFAGGALLWPYYLGMSIIN